MPDLEQRSRSAPTASDAGCTGTTGNRTGFTGDRCRSLVDAIRVFQLLITATELAQCHATANTRCRAKLGDPAWGQQVFEQGHIATAQHVDLDTMLSLAPNSMADTHYLHSNSG